MQIYFSKNFNSFESVFHFIRYNLKNWKTLIVYEKNFDRIRTIFILSKANFDIFSFSERIFLSSNYDPTIFYTLEIEF